MQNQFVIISNNCWGAEIYRTLGLEYNTPFVGLFIYGPDYLKLLKRLDYYLALELSFKNKSRWTDSIINYPIGKLEDIEIHFVHYRNKEEAKIIWERRLARMLKVNNMNDYYFKICDRDKVSTDIIREFHRLPYKNKISFGISEINNDYHITIKENVEDKTVPEGHILYNVSHDYVDIFKWVSTGKLERFQD